MIDDHKKSKSLSFKLETILYRLFTRFLSFSVESGISIAFTISGPMFAEHCFKL